MLPIFCPQWEQLYFWVLAQDDVSPCCEILATSTMNIPILHVEDISYQAGEGAAGQGVCECLCTSTLMIIRRRQKGQHSAALP